MVASGKQKFISPGSGGRKSKNKVLEDLVSGESLLSHRKLSSMFPHRAQRSRDLSGVSFIRRAIPSQRPHLLVSSGVSNFNI